MSLRLDDDLSLLDARNLIDRAIDKTEALGQAGTFVVSDASGTPVAAARMDGAGGTGYNVVRSKTFAASMMGETSYDFAVRMAASPPGIFASYQNIMREYSFPGGGAVPIYRDGYLIGAVSTGLAIGPFVKLAGVDPSRLIVDGKPGNLEDIVISYAMGGGYNPQHGDDMPRWIDAYGEAPDPAIEGTGLQPEPRASRQTASAHASELADYVIGLAQQQGLPVTVMVTDHRSDLIRLYRMDDAPPISVDVAEQIASAAANFRMRTIDIHDRYEQTALAQILTGVRHRMMAVPGGAPLIREESFQGAIGIAGVLPEQAQSLADAAATFFSKVILNNNNEVYP